MKLSEAAANYVAHKQSMGMRFRTEARTLKSFCRAMGEVNLQQVNPNRVHAYLAGTRPITTFWERKHRILEGFYRFVIARGQVLSICDWRWRQVGRIPKLDSAGGAAPTEGFIRTSLALRAARRKKNGWEVSGITPYFRSRLVLRSRAPIGFDNLPI
jgi:hypothetical protein